MRKPDAVATAVKRAASGFRRVERRTIQAHRTRRTVLVEIIRRRGAKRGPSWGDLIKLAMGVQHG